MITEKFQIYSVKITANTFVSQKIKYFYFYSFPKAKLSLGFYHCLPDNFMKRGGYGVEKITKINKSIGNKF